MRREACHQAAPALRSGGLPPRPGGTGGRARVAAVRNQGDASGPAQPAAVRAFPSACGRRRRPAPTPPACLAAVSHPVTESWIARRPIRAGSVTSASAQSPSRYPGMAAQLRWPGPSPRRLGSPRSAARASALPGALALWRVVASFRLSPAAATRRPFEVALERGVGEPGLFLDGGGQGSFVVAQGQDAARSRAADRPRSVRPVRADSNCRCGSRARRRPSRGRPARLRARSRQPAACSAGICAARCCRPSSASASRCRTHGRRRLLGESQQAARVRQWRSTLPYRPSGAGVASWVPASQAVEQKSRTDGTPVPEQDWRSRRSHSGGSTKQFFLAANSVTIAEARQWSRGASRGIARIHHAASRT